MRYEKLLRAIGCSSVIYPTIASPERQIGVSLSTALQQLRRNSILTDIEFSTEGQSIYAHTAVLAAKTGKYATQFNGKWAIDEVIQYDRSTDSEHFLSYHTLSAMIHYTYEEDINWSAMEVSEDDDVTAKATKLELLLDLHKGADSWMMPDLASQIQEKILLAVKSFLNLENVLRIQERAGEARAKAVEQWCTEFIRKNQPTLQTVHPEMPR
jgi:sacsin